MKYFWQTLAVNIVALGLIGLATVMVITDTKGYGWCIFGAIITAGWLITKTTETKE